MNVIERTDADRPEAAADRDARRDGSVGWGAAIIDEQGNEVPITESMITRACEELARCWMVPSSRTSHAH